MKLDRELVEEIKKWSNKATMASSSNNELLMISACQSLMTISGFLKQIGTELERLNEKIKEINDTGL
jgi:hypothetical protein